MEAPERENVTWPVDFVTVTLQSNGKFRALNVIDGCDRGAEFISREFRDWCAGNGINILFTQPGCPTQNGYIERLNGSYRRTVLDAYIFRTPDKV